MDRAAGAARAGWDALAAPTARRNGELLAAAVAVLGALEIGVLIFLSVPAGIALGLATAGLSLLVVRGYQLQRAEAEGPAEQLPRGATDRVARLRLTYGEAPWTPATAPPTNTAPEVTAPQAPAAESSHPDAELRPALVAVPASVGAPMVLPAQARRGPRHTAGGAPAPDRTGQSAPVPESGDWAPAQPAQEGAARLTQELRAEVDRGSRYAYAPTLTVVRLKNEAQIEAKFGPKTTALAQRHVLTTLQRLVRVTDSVATVEPGLFGILIPRCTRREAELFRERVILAVSNRPLTTKDGVAARAAVEVVAREYDEKDGLPEQFVAATIAASKTKPRSSGGGRRRQAAAPLAETA